MTTEAKQLYLKKVRMRYKNATKPEKTKIIDEFHKSYGCSRSHAKRLLNSKNPLSFKSRGRKAKYDPLCIPHLVRLWKVMGRMCSVRMKAVLPLWLSYDKTPDLTDMLRRQICEMSSATIDRYLRPFRENWKKGLSGTTPSAFMKSKIPIELLKDVKEPGYIEADTVIHCGNTMRGEYAVSLTMTDLFSAWTENRACWGKGACEVVQKIAEIRGALPFSLKGFSSDNGTEFLNKALVSYLKDKKQGRVSFTRHRPYKKNDGAHVEQRNYSHVRQVFGYSRLDEINLIMLMNDIYQNYWNPLNNFFCPTLKVVSKERLGGKTLRKYDTPKTPFERLINSDKLTDIQKQNLQLTFEGLNPILLRQTLEKKLSQFQKLLTKEQKIGVIRCELKESA